MHFFQEEQLRRGFRKMGAIPLAHVDHYQRCAATLVYGKYLAILPFRRSAGRYTIFVENPKLPESKKTIPIIFK
jgi:hypothetical protein